MKGPGAGPSISRRAQFATALPTNFSRARTQPCFIESSTATHALLLVSRSRKPAIRNEGPRVGRHWVPLSLEVYP